MTGLTNPQQDAPKIWDATHPGLTAVNVLAGLVGIAPAVAAVLFFFF